MRKDKHVYVVLSQSPTILSKAINRIKGDSFTHAALALDKNLTLMFSFGRRHAWNPFVGCFKRENIHEGMYKRIPSLPGTVLDLAVTQEQYKNVCGLVDNFIVNAHVYGYNYFGLAGNLFGSVYMDSDRFFCSEFVYHVLHESGICDLGIPRAMVRPQTLFSIKSDIVFAGDLKEYCKRQPVFVIPRPAVLSYAMGKSLQ